MKNRIIMKAQKLDNRLYLKANSNQASLNKQPNKKLKIKLIWK